MGAGGCVVGSVGVKLECAPRAGEDGVCGGGTKNTKFGSIVKGKVLAGF